MAVPNLQPASEARSARDWLDREDLTIEELVEAANGVLARIAPTQSRYKVTERVDVRTIRYYAAKKLLPRALGYQGGRARYGSKHLLRLLMLKRMQAEEQTLKQIEKTLKSSSDQEIRVLLFGEDDGDSTVFPAEASADNLSNRFHLSLGGVVEVPRNVLQSEADRKQLAEDLRTLARWLISCTPRSVE